MKKIIVVLILNLLVCLARASESHLTGGVLLSKKRNSAMANFKNTSDSAVYCEQLKFNFKVVEDEFYENIGEFSEVIKSIYLQPGEEVSQNLGSDLQKFSSKTRVAILSEAVSDFSQCRVVNFTDYCKFAPKSSDEMYTLERILAAAKTGSCVDVEPNLKGKLKLREMGIFNVKPISYLSELTNLDLSKNNIISVVDLSKLSQLIKINLSKNPLTEIDSLVLLPNIKTIDVSNTNLKYKEWAHISPTLKKVYVNGTPYGEEKNKH
jgi:hypothetical protein